MPKPEQYSEQELVEGCVRNDRLFQEMLYRRYFPAMLRMCLRYAGDRDTAMEIINTGFLRVFKKIETFSFKGSLEGWIRKLVFHSLADYYKKHNRQVHFLDIADRDAPVPNEALQNLYFEDILSLVDRLPAATREVFYLYAIEGYTHPEIADRVNISVGTSKWHLSAARKKLKQLIQERFNTRNYAG